MIEDGLNDMEFEQFEAHFQKYEEMKATMPEIQNVWIIKPGENTNRGCGIIVSNNFQEIKQIVREKANS